MGINSFNEHELIRYDRQLRVPGLDISAQHALKKARVLCIGAGGLGSPIISYLVGAGVGTLGIIDPDRVEESNLARQVVHRETTVGATKVSSASVYSAGLNSYVSVETFAEAFSPDNARELCQSFDVIVDGSDNFGTKYLANDAAVLAGKPYIWGTVQQMQGQVSTFRDTPAGQGVNLRDVYPDFPRDDTAHCAVVGVLGPICGIVGSIMAAEVIKAITGIGDLLTGKLLVIDAVGMDFYTVEFSRSAHKQPITSLREQDYPHNFFDDNTNEIAGIAVEDFIADSNSLSSENQFVIIDVREEEELIAGIIPDSLHIPLREINSESLKTLLDKNLVFYCSGQLRARSAAAQAHDVGAKKTHYLIGGYQSWRISSINNEKK